MRNEEFVREFEEEFARKGYAFFTQGDYNLNLIGVRSPRDKAGDFDDVMVCLYKVKGAWRVHIWPITTDPGAHYLKNPINKKGCAILVPGQYRSAYVIGEHHGSPALVQHGGPVRVWRDGNEDTTLNWAYGSRGIEGWYGINIHRAKAQGITESPDYHSAGCQVFALASEHKAMMDLARCAAKLYGNSFTYTLIENFN